MAIELFRVCGKCHGDGQFPNAYIDFEGNVVEPESTIDCSLCDGTGQIRSLVIDETFADAFDDLVDKVNDIKDKVDDIKEVVDEL